MDDALTSLSIRNLWDRRELAIFVITQNPGQGIMTRFLRERVAWMFGAAFVGIAVSRLV